MLDVGSLAKSVREPTNAVAWQAWDVFRAAGEPGKAGNASLSVEAAPPCHRHRRVTAPMAQWLEGGMALDGMATSLGRNGPWECGQAALMCASVGRTAKRKACLDVGGACAWCQLVWCCCPSRVSGSASLAVAREFARLARAARHPPPTLTTRPGHLLLSDAPGSGESSACLTTAPQIECPRGHGSHCV